MTLKRQTLEEQVWEVKAAQVIDIGRNPRHQLELPGRNAQRDEALDHPVANARVGETGVL